MLKEAGDETGAMAEVVAEAEGLSKSRAQGACNGGQGQALCQGEVNVAVFGAAAAETGDSAAHETRAATKDTAVGLAHPDTSYSGPWRPWIPGPPSQSPFHYNPGAVRLLLFRASGEIGIG